MNDKECVPFAPSLIESMRSLGYSFSSAIADLIDNSVSAKASDIWIISEPSDDPYLIILDNGKGMSNKELYEAMRYGSSNPLEERSKDDLGRFGLGMKAASLSQCRNLVVISKKRKKISGYSWDLDYVIEKGSWMLREYQEDEIKDFPDIERFLELKSGTYILLRDFDRIKESTNNLAETFNKDLNDMADHLSLVFHRFLNDGLNIYVNGNAIEGRDPFLINHKATQRKRPSRILIGGKAIKLQPYILPHISKLSNADLEKVGGKERIRNDQGFYVYRNKRLIIWGTWFRLERKDELNKLARVQVDIPNSLDYIWKIDIKKSSATLPDAIKHNMYNAVLESVTGSEHVHTYRGRKEKKKDIEYVWERVKLRDGYEYVINRDIPQLKILEETLNDSQIKMLSSVIQTLEDSFPVNALYVDAAKGRIEQKKNNEQEEIESVWAQLQEQIRYAEENNMPVLDLYKAFKTVEPFCNYDEIKNRIDEEIKRYE